MTKELTTMDEATLAKYASMAAPEDSAPIKIPVLKINYDTESKTGRGVWVIGQTKDADGNIVDEGHVTKGLIILAVRKR